MDNKVALWVHRLGKQTTSPSLCLSQYKEKIQHTTTQGICLYPGWGGALNSCKCTSLVHEKKFVIKKCSRFCFICMGHVILYILQKNMNKDNEKADMDNKLWVTLFATFLLVTMRWPLAFAGASRSGLTTAWLTVAISLLWSLFWFYRITMVI